MRLKPPVALPQVLITPHDIGDLLRYGWLRKTVSYEPKGGALTMNLDVAVTLTDPMHGRACGRGVHGRDPPAGESGGDEWLRRKLGTARR